MDLHTWHSLVEMFKKPGVREFLFAGVLLLLVVGPRFLARSGPVPAAPVCPPLPMDEGPSPRSGRTRRRGKRTTARRKGGKRS